MVLMQRADDHVSGRAPVGWRIILVSAQDRDVTRRAK
jgi:hypothetical protein